jgi:guanine deaminase
MILSGQLLRTDTDDRATLGPGTVRVADGYIVEVLEETWTPHADVGTPNTLIAPGFIDAHLHLPQFEMIGAHGLPLLQWLSGVTFPVERKWEDEAYAAERTQQVIGQLLSHGTTGICAYATVHLAGTRAALQVAQDHGVRGVIGQTLMERHAPEFLCRTRAQLIDETGSLLERFPPTERLAAAVTPRFAVTCSAELLRDAGQLAQHCDACIQSHLAETIPECELVNELFGGLTYTDVYGQAGLLTPKAIFGHGIYLQESERICLSRSGARIAHCPTANSFLRSGSMNRRGLLDSGVQLVLGSDIGGGYERSMVRVGRAMIETAAARGDSFPTAAEAWWQITAGNAQALGWRNAGHLRAGNPADLVIIEPDLAWREGPVDPLARLLFAWDDRWIRQTYVRGELAYEA